MGNFFFFYLYFVLLFFLFYALFFRFICVIFIYLAWWKRFWIHCQNVGETITPLFVRLSLFLFCYCSSGICCSCCCWWCFTFIQVYQISCEFLKIQKYKTEKGYTDITPFKKDYKTDKSNFDALILLPRLSKIYERFMRK